MDKSNTYMVELGTGYIFEKNKLILVSNAFEKEVKKYEIFNHDYQLALENYDIKKDEKYIKAVEEALGEKCLKKFSTIISIKEVRDKSYNKELFDEYSRKNFILRKFKNDNFKFRNLSMVEKYINKCEEENEIVTYDHVTLKMIITTNFGDKLSDFISTIGNKTLIGDGEKLRKEAFKEEVLENTLVKVNYSRIDFKELFKELMEWEGNNLNWKGYFGDIIHLFNKAGFKIDEDKEKYLLKDYIASFVHNKSFMFLPFMKPTPEGIYIDIRENKYIYNEGGGGFHKILSKSGNHLYDSKTLNTREMFFKGRTEIGYLFYYEDEEVSICPARYNEVSNRVTFINKLDNLSIELKGFIDKYIEENLDKNKIGIKEK